jgi:hypothetical protein
LVLDRKPRGFVASVSPADVRDVFCGNSFAYVRKGIPPSPEHRTWGSECMSMSDTHDNKKTDPFFDSRQWHSQHTGLFTFVYVMWWRES